MVDARGGRVVIVGGPPASGKTTLAARLADEFSLPLIAKDGLKETLFESIGTGDRKWSERLGRGSFALIWHLLEIELAADRVVLIEGNFTEPYTSGAISRLRERQPFSALQIHCRAPISILYERYLARVETRHAGHVDGDRITDLDRVLDPDRYLLRLSDELLVVETISFDAVDYDAIHDRVRSHLKQ